MNKASNQEISRPQESYLGWPYDLAPLTESLQASFLCQCTSVHQAAVEKYQNTPYLIINQIFYPTAVIQKLKYLQPFCLEPLIWIVTGNEHFPD